MSQSLTVGTLIVCRNVAIWSVALLVEMLDGFEAVRRARHHYPAELDLRMGAT